MRLNITAQRTCVSPVVNGFRKKTETSAKSSQPPFRKPGVLNRKEALATLAAILTASPTLEAIADEAGPSVTAAAQFTTFSNSTLAYSFDYPTSLADGSPISLLLTRSPERYSSAAPLTADARQRIVLELADLRNAITVSVSVGPPSPYLKSTGGGDPQQWNARTVAEQVLVDRSTARVTNGQRVSLNSLESVTTDDRNGATYYVYEHVSKGSPTTRSGYVKETYRHALAVTAMRPGSDGSLYLYTLNLACPEDLYSSLEEGFRRSIASFKLDTPGPEYVAPDQESWRFF